MALPYGEDNPHAARRLARYIVAAVGSNHDPRTFSNWARNVGVSATSLRVYCHLAALGPKPCKPCLDFARLLRVAVHRSINGYPLEYLLDIADERTMRSLITRAGVTYSRFPQGGAAFIDQQTLIKDSVLLAQIRVQLELIEPSSPPSKSP